MNTQKLYTLRWVAYPLAGMLAAILLLTLRFLPGLSFAGDSRHSEVLRPRSEGASADITVNTLVDENDGSCSDGDCSLRDALQVANPDDMIDFNLTYPATITLTSGQLTIDKNLTINGPGAHNLTISGNQMSRVIWIAEGAMVSISGVTIANGNADSGGGIYSEGTVLNVSNCIFSDNRATSSGGAIFLYNSEANVTHTTFNGNTARGGTLGGWGGAIRAHETTLTVLNSTFSDNSADIGGAISFWNGEANVINTSFNRNTASKEVAGGSGGAIDVLGATLTVLNSTFTENQSIGAWGTGGGGGIRIIHGSTTVSNTTFYSNTSTHQGGGIVIYQGRLEVHNSTFSGNRAGDGGGIYNVDDDENTACVSIVNTIVANSTAGGNCSGLIDASSTNNLSTDATCSPGFTQITPAQLALGSLTGNPAYFPLNPGSVAIDAVTNDKCPDTDQRGVARPQDGNGDGTAICDVGSYEAIFMVNPTPIPTLTPPPGTMDQYLYLPLILRTNLP